MPRFALLLVCALPMSLAGPFVQAQQIVTSPVCAAPVEIPPALAGWTAPDAMKAAASVKASATAPLTPGRAVRLKLLPTPKVAYPLRPEKPGGSVSFGGLISFTVAEEGVWRVALSSGAWVDVVNDGKASQSVAHGRGPDCSGIRKMVDYRLAPGTYTLQIAANGADVLTLLVARLP
jgi:hypothetical protein